MNSSKAATIFGIGMIVGSVPCTLAIALFLYLMAARQEGHPIAGDALGVMMISLMAYGIALISFFCGTVYFIVAALKKKLLPRAWHWFGIVYSFSQVAIPVVYFSTR
jgi:hypothetical protein